MKMAILRQSETATTNKEHPPITRIELPVEDSL